MRYLFYNKCEQKYRVLHTYYTNNDYINVIKFMRITFDREQAENAKSAERKKLVFQNNR